MPTIDFITLVISLRAHVAMNGPLWMLVTAACWISAVIFGWVTLRQLKEVAENQRHSYFAPMVSFVACAMMGAAPELISTLLVSTFSNDWGASPLSYVKDPGGSNLGFSAVMTLVSFIGFVFVVRGIWIVKEAGEPQRYPQSTIGKAIWVLFAGMCALYIDFTLKLIANTFAIDLSLYLN